MDQLLNAPKENNRDFFDLTVGGMGLSGIILSVKFFLRRIETSYIIQKKKKLNSLDAIMDQFESSDDWNYSVAWINGFSKKLKNWDKVFF